MKIPIEFQLMNIFIKNVQIAALVLLANATLQAVSIAIQVYDYYTSVERVEESGLMVQRVWLGAGFRFIDIFGSCVSFAVGVFLFIAHRHFTAVHSRQVKPQHTD